MPWRNRKRYSKYSTFEFLIPPHPTFVSLRLSGKTDPRQQIHVILIVPFVLAAKILQNKKYIPIFTPQK